MEEKAPETEERKEFVIQSSERLGESSLEKGGGVVGWAAVQSDEARLMLWVSGEDGAGMRTKRAPAPPPAQWYQGRKEE